MKIFTHLLVPVATAASIAVAVPSFAASPHFVSASVAQSGTGLAVSFKEAGLGSNTLVTIKAQAVYSAVFQCINGGGKNPSAANKTTVDGSAAESGSFTSGKNGQVTGALTLAAPTVTDNDFTCPSGQREVLTQLTWSGVTLDDLTSSASTALDGKLVLGQAV